MPSGLVALLDDVAGITKLAAASLDDVSAAAGKAGSKAMGVVIDDAAVTPRYAVGFTPDRELPIIWKIALGSFRNKLIFLLPGALLLSAFAPWAVTPLLMLGGCYLCFEGAEKVIELFETSHDEEEAPVTVDVASLEQEKVNAAIRTDLILSAEIMAIALADVAAEPILTQAFVLALVGIAITVAVYGVVGLIVKMDDIGLHLSRKQPASIRLVGRGLVEGMPLVMQALSAIGTAAMIWGGGGIIVHGLETLGLGTIAHVIHPLAEQAGKAIPALEGSVSWTVGAIGSGIFGLVTGGAIAIAIHAIAKLRRPKS